MRALVVTAVAAEAESAAAGLTPHPDPVAPEPRTLPGGYLITRRDLPGLAVDVLVGGVGPAAAAAATATALALADYSLVVSAGIGGGFAPAAAHGLPVLEIRAVSNAVGPRDRSAWRIGEA
ncbi:futalosine hydrolase, partial [Streptomyces sp. NPDC054901]